MRKAVGVIVAAAVRQPVHRALAVLAVVVAAAAAVVAALVHAGPLGGVELAYAFPALAVLYAAAGLVAWWRRPANRLGSLLVLGGAATLAASLANTGVPVLIAAGTVTAVLPISVVLHLLHACPTGRLRGRVSRAAVAAAYAVGLLLQAPQYAFRPAEPPYHLLVVADRPGLATAGERAQEVLGALVVAVTVAVLVRRLREHEGRQRWVLAPLFGCGVLAVVAVPLVANVLQPLLGLGQEAAVALQLVALATVPLGFLAVVLRGGFARTGELDAFVTSLASSSGSSRELESAVATTLGDPSATLLQWSPEDDGYVDADGRRTSVPADHRRAALDVEAGGRRLGVIVHEPDADPAVLAAVGRVAAIALDRERLAREVLASREALREASSRLLADSDRGRRRIAQDLHDGLQVSLVRMALQVGRLGQEPDGTAVGVLAAKLATEVDEAATALRALVHGVMPAPLLERGLVAAVQELAYDLPVRVRVDRDGVPGRLPTAVESTAYFIVAEALTNVVKHAGASSVDVAFGLSGGVLTICVADDGHGVDDPDLAGSGLSGLRDRAEVLGGTLSVDTGPGGTTLRAALPCA